MKTYLKGMFILFIFMLFTSSAYAESSALDSIEYYKNGDRVSIIIKGARMTDPGEKVNNNFLMEESDDHKKVRITFPLGSKDLGEGTLVIGDKNIRAVILKKDMIGLSYHLTLYARKAFKYHIITRYKSSGEVIDTAITLLPITKPNRLVVIDAGHGGHEVGASKFNLQEKNLNLEIAKLLEKELKRRRINTYMIRSEDIHVGLYERAYIANTLDADLFVSVHHNAFLGKTRGTETLYFPGIDSTGKMLAQNIQNLVVEKARTIDRGIIPRPNLVVLRKTEMPAALVEVGYMDNISEVRRLTKKSFMIRVAKSIADGIRMTLKQHP